MNEFIMKYYLKRMKNDDSEMFLFYSQDNCWYLSDKKSFLADDTYMFMNIKSKGLCFKVLKIKQYF